MKKLSALFLILGLTFSLVSCSKTENVGSNSAENESTDKTEEAETVEEPGIVPVHIKEDSYYISGSTDVDGVYFRPSYLSISRPVLEEGDRERFPLLAKVLDDQAENLSGVAKDRFKKLLSDGSFLVEAGNNVQAVFEEDTLHVMRADSNVLSMATYASISQGGVHGDYTVVSENYDTKTGEVIKFSDVVKDTDAFFDQVDVSLSNQYRDLYEELRPVKERVAEMDLDRDLTWWMTADSLSVYFSYYDLAGYYAGGSQTVSVSFSENKDIFNEKYTEALDEFIFPIDSYSFPGLVDADSNGSFEYISLAPVFDEYDYGNMNIFLNGKDMSLEIGYNEPDIYVMKKAGKYYLYVFCHYENDYVVCKVVDLDSMVELESVDSEGVASEWIEMDTFDSEEENNGYTYSVYGSRTIVHHITDPDAMMLNVHMDLLGTWNAIGEYAAGDDGIAKLKETDFVRERADVLKLLKDVDCVTVDNDGKDIGSESLKSGTFLMMRRTDGKSFVDFLVIDPKLVKNEGNEYYSRYILPEDFEVDKNGTLYRMQIERIDYLHKVEGMPEEELLEGMMYAG